MIRFSALVIALFFTTHFAIASESMHRRYNCTNETTVADAAETRHYGIFFPTQFSIKLGMLRLRSMLPPSPAVPTDCTGSESHETKKAALLVINPARNFSVEELTTDVTLQVQVDKKTCEIKSVTQREYAPKELLDDGPIPLGASIFWRDLRLNFDEKGEVTGGYEILPLGQITEADSNKILAKTKPEDLDAALWEVNKLSCSEVVD